MVAGMNGSLGSVDSSREEDAAGLSSGDEGRSGASRYSPEDTQRKLQKGADTVRSQEGYPHTQALGGLPCAAVPA